MAKTNKIETVEETVSTLPMDVKEVSTSLVLSHEYESCVKSINNALKNVTDGFLTIGKTLNDVETQKIYAFAGFENVYDFAKENFSLGETSVKNYISVFKRFGDPSTYSGRLKEKYKEYSFTQLVELIPMKDDEIKKVTPEFNIKEIRSIKKVSQLTSDVKKLNAYCFDAISKTLVDLKVIKVDLESKINDYTHYNSAFRIQGTCYLGSIKLELSFDFEPNDARLFYISLHDSNYDIYFTNRDNNLTSLLSNLTKYITQEVPKKISSVEKKSKEKQNEKLEEKKKKDFEKTLKDATIGELIEYISNLENYAWQSSSTRVFYVRFLKIASFDFFCITKRVGQDKEEIIEWFTPYCSIGLTDETAAATDLKTFLTEKYKEEQKALEAKKAEKKANKTKKTTSEVSA